MNKFKEFQRAFIRNLKRLFGLTEGKSNDEVDAILLSEAKNDEERRVFKEILAESRHERELMREWQMSGKRPDEWLEEKVEKELKEIYPEASVEEIQTVHEAIENSFVDDIRDSAEILVNEMEYANNSDIMSDEENEKPNEEMKTENGEREDENMQLFDSNIVENVESECGEEDRV